MKLWLMQTQHFSLQLQGSFYEDLNRFVIEFWQQVFTASEYWEMQY